MRRLYAVAARNNDGTWSECRTILARGPKEAVLKGAATLVRWGAFTAELSARRILENDTLTATFALSGWRYNVFFCRKIDRLERV